MKQEMKMTSRAILLLLFLCLMGTWSNDMVAQSYNNQAVEAIQRGQTGQAIYLFEKGLRSGSADRRMSRKNVSAFRSEKDLPAHTLLHFGWTQGIGKLMNRLPKNSLLFMGIGMLLFLIYRILKQNKTSWPIIIGLLGGSLLCFALSYCRSSYLAADHLIVFMKDATLRDKPYEISDEMQVVFEGQMAQVLSKYEGFYEVQTDTYETGWVDQNFVVFVGD